MGDGLHRGRSVDRKGGEDPEPGRRFTRECLALEADSSLGSGRVTRVLERRFEERDRPEAERSDNSPEFTSRPMLGWAEDHRIALVHVQLTCPR